MVCTCRKRFSAGVPGAVALGKINLESPPSPEGKGVGGMGRQSKLKAGQTGDKECKPPAGRVVRPLPQCRPGSAAGHLYGRVCTCRKRFSAGVPGAVAPGKINLESPPSPEGKGAGGWGQKSKLKAGATGNQEGKPPCKFRNGTVTRRPKRQAPLQIPEWHGQPATKKASPLPAGQKTPPHSGTPCGAPPQGGENAESSG